MRLANLILCSLFIVLSHESFANSNAQRILGNWIIDIDTSDDSKKILNGKLRKSYQPEKINKKHPTSRPKAGGATVESYWKTIRQSQERKASKNFRRLGTAFLILTCEKINITKDAKYLGHMLISYDKSPNRRIKPNSQGRVFSAKGDELTHSYFGHTLAYFQNNVLILETDAPDGGKYLEKISLENNTLSYQIILKSLVLKEPVTVKRVFNRM